MARARRGRRRAPWWHDLSYEQLLDVRLCELDIDIDGTALRDRVDRLHGEFERKGLRFRPHVWLSTEWFSPDGITGFAIPFYLAHRRLQRIEHRQMFEVEGGTHGWCLRLLRHEAGHAIDNAYRLHRRKRWREIFGRHGDPYRATYVPKPNSREHVQNLGFWYAQSHPVEDFAETFAIWLQPGSHWRTRYDGWPAMDKLAYVDELMSEIAAQPPPVRCRQTPDSLRRLRMTLREYYREKKAQYATESASGYDRHLRKLFGDDDGHAGTMSAAEFLRRSRHDLRARVAALTGQYRYVVDQILRLLILRCRELGLRLTRPDRDVFTDAAILVTILTARVVRHGRSRYHR